MYAKPVHGNNFSALSLVGYKWDFTTNIVFVSRLNKNAEISPTDNIHGALHLGLDQDLSFE